jgi:hypothetical protein
MVRRDRPALGLVAVQERLRRPALEHGGELPADVDRVADAGVEPVPAPRRVQVRGVADEEHPLAAAAVHQQPPRRPPVGGEDVDLDVGADERAHQRDRVDLLGGRVDALDVDALDDGPPRAIEIQPAHEPAGRGADDPVVDAEGAWRAAVRLGGAEGDRQVGQRARRALVPGADGRPGHPRCRRSRAASRP